MYMCMFATLSWVSIHIRACFKKWYNEAFSSSSLRTDRSISAKNRQILDLVIWVEMVVYGLIILADFKTESAARLGVVATNSNCVSGWNIPIEKVFFRFAKRTPFTTYERNPSCCV